MAALFASAIGSHGMAQDATATDQIYQSGVERIDASDKLRMLIQEISVAACLVDADVDADTYRGAISQGIAEFDALLAALETGDAAYGIGSAEENRKMLSAIRGLALQWERLKIAAQSRVDDAPVEDGVDFLSRQNLNSMHAAKYLVLEATNTYAVPPALLQLDAFTINILARQRSLTQQMAKEACGVITGNTIMGREARLQNAVGLFDASLDALINGLPSAGVAAPSSADISERLMALSSDWSDIKADLAGLAGQEDAQKAGDLYQSLADLRASFDEIMPLYIEDSKSGL